MQIVVCRMGRSVFLHWKLSTSMVFILNVTKSKNMISSSISLETESKLSFFMHIQLWKCNFRVAQGERVEMIDGTSSAWDDLLLAKSSWRIFASCTLFSHLLCRTMLTLWSEDFQKPLHEYKGLHFKIHLSWRSFLPQTSLNILPASTEVTEENLIWTIACMYCVFQIAFSNGLSSQ